MNATTSEQLAISIAEQHLQSGGFCCGPCIGALSIGSTDTSLWEIEFAHVGLTSRSPTTDPESMRVQVNLTTKEARSIDLM